jgi:hypothetical protein
MCKVKKFVLSNILPLPKSLPFEQSSTRMDQICDDNRDEQISVLAKLPRNEKVNGKEVPPCVKHGKGFREG